MRIAVVDGQGGGIGRHIVERIRREFPEDTDILALGTNALAASVMIKAGANEGASGENAVVLNAPLVEIIAGPVSIMFPNAMLGELTPAMASAISSSPAVKYLLPVTRHRVEIIGVRTDPLPHMIDELVVRIKENQSRKKKPGL